MQKETDENGRRRYYEDSVFRAEVEAIRIEAFGGPAVPVAQQQPAEQPVVEPQGTPESRAESELIEHLEAGGQVGQADVDAATWQQMTAGYTVNLPDTHVLNLETCDMLANARAAGISQATVDQYIKTALRN